MSQKTHKQHIGRQGENIASNFLRKLGHKIIGRNYRTKCGEIDIIARDKETLVFVEVKTRSDVEMGYPELNITPSKLQNFRSSVQIYVSENNVTCGYSLDVLSVDLSKTPPEITHFKNITM